MQRVTISATTRDYSYSIDSPDSSLFRFLLNCVNSIIKYVSIWNIITSTKLFNYHFFYDTISMPSPISYVFLSPFGQSSITLKNNLLNPDYILRIKVEFSKGIFFQQPVMCRIFPFISSSFINESNSIWIFKKVINLVWLWFRLYYSKFFYYIAAGLFAPIIVLIYASFSAIT